MFNVYEKTYRFRGKATKDSPSTAGTAKIPRVGVNKSDLEAQGELYGWAARELTYKEVREMSSSELRWHEQFNATNLEKALASPAKIKEGKDIDQKWATKKLWDNETRPTPEQAAAIGEAVEKFLQTYPQVMRRPENHHSILVWLKDRNMEITLSNLVESFQANALEGKVWLNPNAISAGSETEVTGQQLLLHHNFFKLIQPQQRMSETDRLSADEYFKQNKEMLADRRVPPIIQARAAQNANTAAYFQQAEARAAKSGVTTVVDYEHEPGRGVPPYSDIEKASFRNLLRNLSSQEFVERCTDPQFKASVDRLDSEKE